MELFRSLFISVIRYRLKIVVVDDVEKFFD